MRPVGYENFSIVAGKLGVCVRFLSHESVWGLSHDAKKKLVLEHSVPLTVEQEAHALFL